MDDYLEKFGFTPNDLGMNQFIPAMKPVKPMKPTPDNNDNNMMQNDFNNTLLKNLPLTMAYVPFQQYDDSYEQQMALACGTLFPELNKPFTGKRN